MSSKPIYALHYFNGRGRAEPIRLIFVQAGEKFEDHRYSYEEWATAKSRMPLGQVPVLEIDREKYPQSVSIGRHLARQFKLGGSDEMQSMKCDIVVDTIQEINEEYFRVSFQLKDEKLKEQALIKFKTDSIPLKLEGLEKLINQYGNGTWAVGKEVTWADLWIYDVIENLLGIDEQVLEKYPTLQKNRQAVEKLPKIAEYLLLRKDTRS